MIEGLGPLLEEIGTGASLPVSEGSRNKLSIPDWGQKSGTLYGSLMEHPEVGKLEKGQGRVAPPRCIMFPTSVI